MSRKLEPMASRAVGSDHQPRLAGEITPGLPCGRARLAGSAMFSVQAWAQIACALSLSGRELQIVRGTFDDRTEFAIADDLQIATSTVHTHVERLHHKLGVTDRAQLILRVMQEFMALTASPWPSSPPVCANRAPGRRCFRR